MILGITIRSRRVTPMQLFLYYPMVNPMLEYLMPILIGIQVMRLSLVKWMLFRLFESLSMRHWHYWWLLLLQEKWLLKLFGQVSRDIVSCREVSLILHRLLIYEGIRLDFPLYLCQIVWFIRCSIIFGLWLIVALGQKPRPGLDRVHN